MYQSTENDLQKSDLGEKKRENSFYSLSDVSSSRDMSTDTGQIQSNWYLGNRVQVLTRLLEKDIHKEYFWKFPVELSEVGNQVIIRQIKSHDEAPWWPSKYGKVSVTAPEYISGKNNLATKIINQTHDLGMKQIVYYRHTEEAEILAKHPEWASRGVKNNLLKMPRGYGLCINSPYRNIVFGRILELTKFGADGFYFDNKHIPPKGCFCEYCSENYKKIFGTNIKDDFLNGNLSQFYQFRNISIKDFFDDMNKEVMKTGVNPVFIISASAYPNFSSLEMSNDIFDDYAIKTELNIPLKVLLDKGELQLPPRYEDQISSFSWNAFCFSNARDNSYLPPNVWCPRLKNEADIMKVVSGLISLGCVANIDLPANTNIDLNSLKDIFNLNLNYENIFKSAIPNSEVAIYIPENERYNFINDSEAYWQNLILPAYSVFTELYDLGISIKILSDENELLAYEESGKYICMSKEMNKEIFDSAKKHLDFNLIQKLSKEEIISYLKPEFYLDKNTVNVNSFSDGRTNYLFIGADFSDNILINYKDKKNLMTFQSKAAEKQEIKLFVNKNRNPEDSFNITDNQNLKRIGENTNYFIYSIVYDNRDLILLKI